MKNKKYHIDTLLVHAENKPEQNRRSTTMPIYQTTAFKYNSSEEISEVFNGEAAGNIYTRISNPTLEILEKKLAVLEDGLGAIVAASGMAAITCAVLTLAKNGDHVVAGNSIFGGTYSFFDKTIREFGIDTAFVDPADAGQFESAIKDNTKAFFIETIGNPKIDVPDIAAIAKIAKKNNVPLIVDSTVTTPYLVRPKDFGANIVIHSTSKFINGHGNSLGGVIIDCGNFDWKDEKYGALSFLIKTRKAVFRDFGACLSPNAAFLTDIGLETLSLRMERHCSNALALAKFLEKHPKVKAVSFPGLADNRFHNPAKKQFNGKFGSLLTFRLKDRRQCFKAIDSLRLAYNLANIGDAKTLVIHPASTLCVEFNDKERENMGVSDDLIRVSVGIEYPDDIIDDFSQALEAI
ncbi:acetyl-L-homoserine sulfhydrolase [candidate division WOR-1 bacterium RIFOXYA12_FULL_43_27]|uniref:homocysteine desulfhydrase n=1 Tax=candidate division WOR-1 bacterium RIFOXYC2_FULL_46_14 TaxID=1802587 RepID=A0A1F4U6P6_UNCSA|nr:MAG: acetyl-L-homoserine sulfhydrolase [candidate division WOR-1 bacterium RIFOXYA12_FULL_43_27]OGC19526.1 MAG: acetyl-L-homoserine sulfhydrolase [candidate division WOR-1 bacterium RIFOXYB2_FULL_46_45]OGC30514.1 MAG: acetyl-L-homoserine sulfhydrolase [candidate division WOR-1 bacterium RIFOXYA2_FULL_46_56]OGC40582.1 MAG: acetyl-L-homoserine sulfhydrolase [candidate division WOR-1 bacterium RIFOXYC2_FULL_46_14]